MRCLVLLLALAAADAWADTAINAMSARQEGEFIVLENGAGMRAVVAPERGGELAGFSILKDGRRHELLYRAMDYGAAPGWRGKAPLLWPATGVSVTADGERNAWQLRGKTYPMPFHGFARDRAWQVLATREAVELASVTLQMRADEESRRLYPFDFVLEAEYQLDRDLLAITYEVTAGDGNHGPMPFSIGNHITFRAPLIAGPDPASLEFECDFPNRLLTGADKAFSGDMEPSPFRGRHGLGELPRRQAVSLSDSHAGPAELTLLDPSGLVLRLVHQVSKAPSRPAIRFTLWADIEDGFFSPEPWVGTQNSLNNGMGLVWLEPGESWQWRMELIPGPAERPVTVNRPEEP